MVAMPYGHASYVVAGAGLLALVLHLAVPMYTEWTDGDGFGDKESETYTRGEMADLADASGSSWVDAAGPGITLAGTIVLAAGGLLLLVPSLVPMGVTGARGIGWAGGTLGLAGAAMATISSAYWAGGQVTAVLMAGAGATREFAAYWSPLLVGALGFAAFVHSLRVLRVIVPSEGGLRDRASDQHRVAVWALTTCVVALAVPWSMTTGSAFDATEDYHWYSAHEVQSLEGATDGELFAGMSYTLSVFVLGTYIAIGLSALAGSSGLMARVPGTDGLRRMLEGTTFLSAFLLVWMGILYLLAWTTYWKPADGVPDHQPGYFPLVVLATLGMLGWAVFDALKASFGGATRRGVSDPAAFDA